MTEASASVGLLLATVLVTQSMHEVMSTSTYSQMHEHFDTYFFTVKCNKKGPFL